MSEKEVADLMASSNSVAEWNANIKTVKTAFDGDYPPFWYSVIIASGIGETTANKWHPASQSPYKLTVSTIDLS